jgi:hypothetical protein
MATQIGAHAVVFGLPDAGADTVKVGTTASPTSWAFKITGVDYRKEADEETTQNETGDVLNSTSYNFRERLTLTGYPYGANTAAAITANLLPTIGHLVRLTGSNATNDDADWALASTGTDWKLTGASKALTNAGKATITLECVRYAGISSYVHLS